MTRWFFNNALAQKRTHFGQISQHDLQILPKQNTDFVHFIYWTNTT